MCHVHLRGQKPRNPAYPKEIQTLGDQIRARRMDLGLLEKQVAEILGASETSVFNWERNATKPGIRCLPRIYDFLDFCPWRPTRNFGEWLRIRREALGMMVPGVGQGSQSGRLVPG